LKQIAGIYTGVGKVASLARFALIRSKAQRMYEMVILATGFGEFEFSRTFSLLLFHDQKCVKIQPEIPQMSKNV